MIEAIVYTSNAGTTAQYAKMIGSKMNLPVYSIEEAKQNIKPLSQILYLGWLMAGGIKGYKEVTKQYKIIGVCGVGMGGTGTQIDDIRKRNNIPSQTAVFTLQGGFHMEKLSGINKLLMKIMCATAGKSLAKKSNRTEDEERMLDMMQNGADYVDEANIKYIIDWMNNLV